MHAPCASQASACALCASVLHSCCPGTCDPLQGQEKILLVPSSHPALRKAHFISSQATPIATLDTANFYTEKFLHTEARSSCTQKLLHREAFTHRSPKLLHADAFATQHGNIHPAIPLRSAAQDAKTAFNYVHRNTHRAP